MRLSDFFSPTVNLILAIGGLIFGIVCLVSGLRGERKSFFAFSAFDDLIKNPIFNIVYGIILILIFALAIIWYGAEV